MRPYCFAMVHYSGMAIKPRVETVGGALARASKLLQPKKITCPADRGLGMLDAEILLAHVLKKDRAWLHAHGEAALSPAHAARFAACVERRRKHEPVAYIIGYKDFYGIRIAVRPSVLIPRPSSERVVDLLLASVPKPSSVIDLGTGTGAIALAVAIHLPNAVVLGTDISPDALRVARANATRLGISNVSFQHADLLSPAVISKAKKVKRPLVLTANLPYLPTRDRKTLAPDVVNYEPHGALFSGKDGNDHILRFLDQLRDSRLDFTAAFIECDPPQAKTVRLIAKHYFPSATIVIHKDLERHDRVLGITRVKKILQK